MAGMASWREDAGVVLPVVEEFYTLQGEGAHTGRAAYFVRLAGCDVGCPWCDSRDSWAAGSRGARDGGFPVAGVDGIVARAAAFPARTVVVTGGEPTMHDLGGLCDGLRSKGIAVHLETSGTHPLTGAFDWVCLSPKRRKPPLDEVWAVADELKVVIETVEDLAWAEDCAAKVAGARAGGRTGIHSGVRDEAIAGGGSETIAVETQLFLQPEWSRRAEMVPVLVEYVKQNPRWRISLQTHKYIEIP